MSFSKKLIIVSVLLFSFLYPTPIHAAGLIKGSLQFIGTFFKETIGSLPQNIKTVGEAMGDVIVTAQNSERAGGDLIELINGFNITQIVHGLPNDQKIGGAKAEEIIRKSIEFRSQHPNNIFNDAIGVFKVSELAENTTAQLAQLYGNIQNLTIETKTALVDDNSIQCTNIYSFFSNIGYCVVSGISSIVGAFMGLVASFIFKIALLIIPWAASLSNIIFESVGIRAGWDASLQVVNLGFVIAIIVIAFATMLRRESYSMRTLLPKLIIVALLINFSFVITRTLVTISDSLSVAILEQVSLDPVTFSKAFSFDRIDFGSNDDLTTTGRSYADLEKDFNITPSIVRVFAKIIFGPSMLFFIWISFFIMNHSTSTALLNNSGTLKLDLDIPSTAGVIGNMLAILAILFGGLTVSDKLGVVGGKKTYDLAIKGRDWAKSKVKTMSAKVGIQIATAIPLTEAGRTATGWMQKAFGLKTVGRKVSQFAAKGEKYADESGLEGLKGKRAVQAIPSLRGSQLPAALLKMEKEKDLLDVDNVYQYLTPRYKALFGRYGQNFGKIEKALGMNVEAAQALQAGNQEKFVEEQTKFYQGLKKEDWSKLPMNQIIEQKLPGIEKEKLNLAFSGVMSALTKDPANINRVAAIIKPKNLDTFGDLAALYTSPDTSPDLKITNVVDVEGKIVYDVLIEEARNKPSEYFIHDETVPLKKALEMYQEVQKKKDDPKEKDSIAFKQLKKQSEKIIQNVVDSIKRGDPTKKGVRALKKFYDKRELGEYREEIEIKA